MQSTCHRMACQRVAALVLVGARAGSAEARAEWYCRAGSAPASALRWRRRVRAAATAHSVLGLEAQPEQVGAQAGHLRPDVGRPERHEHGRRAPRRCCRPAGRAARACRWCRVRRTRAPPRRRWRPAPGDHRERGVVARRAARRREAKRGDRVAARAEFAHQCVAGRGIELVAVDDDAAAAPLPPHAVERAAPVAEQHDGRATQRRAPCRGTPRCPTTSMTLSSGTVRCWNSPAFAFICSTRRTERSSRACVKPPCSQAPRSSRR